VKEYTNVTLGVFKITSKLPKTKIMDNFWMLKKHVSIIIVIHLDPQKFCNKFQQVNTSALLCQRRGEVVLMVTASSGKQPWERNPGSEGNLKTDLNFGV